jgi:Fur family peroxide stress response transcriptional regulator
MVDRDIAAGLRERGLRVTPQRLAILQAFRGTVDEHLSAEEVTSRASMVVSSIGRGTVYATLAELAEVGLLGSIGSSEPVRYETNLTAHDHFRCRVCMRLFDVDLGGGELAGRPLPGYAIETIAVRAEGVCPECQAYLRGLTDGAAHCLDVETLPRSEFDSLSCQAVDTPLGELALVASSEGVVHLSFSDHADFHDLSDHARSGRGSAAARARLRTLVTGLDRYFQGDRAPMEDLIDWRLLSPAQQSALRSVQRIPFGGRISYEQLGSSLSAYDLGWLFGSNPLPLITPCHRISRGGSRPEAYVGGVERLQVLQALESA